MNKLILALFLLVCVGAAIAGYGSGTPGYYDPWTYYGGYDYYYNRNYGRGQSRYNNNYYPISRYGNRGGSSNYPRPYYNSGGRSSYNKISYDDRRMYDDYSSY